MTDSTVRGDSPHLATHIDKDVEENASDPKTFAQRDREREERNRPERDFEPASEAEVYEGAERAKADFVQAATGDTPEPTGDEQVPPAQRRAQERVARERH